MPLLLKYPKRPDTIRGQSSVPYFEKNKEDGLPLAYGDYYVDQTNSFYTGSFLTVRKDWQKYGGRDLPSYMDVFGYGTYPGFYPEQPKYDEWLYHGGYAYMSFNVYFGPQTPASTTPQGNTLVDIWLWTQQTPAPPQGLRTAEKIYELNYGTTNAAKGRNPQTGFWHKKVNFFHKFKTIYKQTPGQPYPWSRNTYYLGYDTDVVEYTWTNADNPADNPTYLSGTHIRNTGIYLPQSSYNWSGDIANGDFQAEVMTWTGYGNDPNPPPTPAPYPPPASPVPPIPTVPVDPPPAVGSYPTIEGGNGGFYHT